MAPDTYTIYKNVLHLNKHLVKSEILIINHEYETGHPSKVFLSMSMENRWIDKLNINFIFAGILVKCCNPSSRCIILTNPCLENLGLYQQKSYYFFRSEIAL